ncbi:substrate-binding domain-containing protein [Halorubrum tebenquichense]|uniref:substrate-binding domain-containing protein n=1 Tax=Halorubrum tebenquichense TaxID=119434 RepID=UPI00187DB476|nr:substrate-binding domain-containing protein [Halorubrum tebenquichense]
MDRRSYLQAVGAGGVVSLAGCGGAAPTDEEPTASVRSLTLAATTTINDSGLLDELTPGFTRAFGPEVNTVVRGTGGALRTARNGDCDVVLVHARSLEDAFLRAGEGTNRRTVMVNDFLVVGPPDDPAGIAGSPPVTAFRDIASAEAAFLSRGDRSGTHIRERQLWSEAGVDPTGDWYGETGQGMGNTLSLAAETGSYTLTDRGTFLNVAGGDLAAHVDRGIEDPGPLLRNEYAVIPVNPGRHDVAYPLAMAFTGHLTGPAQDAIEEFRIDGEAVFRPVTRSESPEFGQYVPSDWR